MMVLSRKNSDLVFIALLVLTLVLLGWNGLIVKDKQFECVQNPIVYGMKDLGEKYNFNPMGNIFGVTPQGAIVFTMNSTDISVRQDLIP